MALRIEILDVSDRLVGATMNGICQGIVLAVLVALAMRLVGRTNAATRHAIWFFTLLLMMGIIPANCLRDYLFQDGRHFFSAGERTLLSTAAGGASVAPDAATTTPLAHVAMDSHGGELSERDADEKLLTPSSVDVPAEKYSPPVEAVLSPNDFTLLLPSSEELNVNKPTGHVHQPSIVVLPDGASRLEGAALFAGPAQKTAAQNELASASPSPKSAGAGWPADRFPNPISWNLYSSAQIPPFVSPVLLGFWLTIVAARTLVLLGRLGRIRKLKADGLPPDEPLALAFQKLCSEFEVGRKVKLKLSCAQRCPMVLGFLHPVILLPAKQGETLDRVETEHILRHELAHVRRHDDWANLIQQLIQTLLFFHPGVWWISRQLALEREFACDDYVLQQGGRPRAYALLLADLASRLTKRPLLLAPGISTNNSQLQQRINMILDTRRNTSPLLSKTRLGMVSSAVAIVAVFAVYAAPRLVLAQAAKPARAAAIATPTATAAATPSVSVVTFSDSDAADAAPRTVPPAASESGPLFKSESSQDTPRPEMAPVPPRALLAPATPLPPQVLVAPVPVTPPIVALGDLPGQPGAMPRRPRAPAPDSDSSIEERLARLEEIVRSLLAREHPGHPSPDALARKHAQPEDMPSPKDIEKIQELAERQAARAAEQAKRAAEQVDRQMRALGDRREHGKQKEVWGKQIESLRRQREALERQMEHLERQIEKLEQEQEKLDQQEENQSEEKESEAKQEEQQNEEKQKGECESKKVEAPAEQ